VDEPSRLHVSHPKSTTTTLKRHAPAQGIEIAYLEWNIDAIEYDWRDDHLIVLSRISVHHSKVLGLRPSGDIEPYRSHFLDAHRARERNI